MKLKTQDKNGADSMVAVSSRCGWSAAYIKQIADLLGRQVIPNYPAGFTFCTRTRHCLFGNAQVDAAIFVVSIAGCGLIIQGIPNNRDLADWITAQSSLLFEPGYYIGGWRTDGLFFLDVSMLVVGYESAIKLGKSHSQETVYHPASNEVIPVASSYAKPCLTTITM